MKTIYIKKNLNAWNTFKARLLVYINQKYQT
jgi:hypothetical protein